MQFQIHVSFSHVTQTQTVRERGCSLAASLVPVDHLTLTEMDSTVQVRDVHYTCISVNNVLLL